MRSLKPKRYRTGEFYLELTEYNKDSCEGCNVNHFCKLWRYSNDCPCKTCLIKTMCSEECLIFSIFEDSCMDIMEKEGKT